MSKTKHTPGPWQFSRLLANPNCHVSSKKGMIASIPIPEDGLYKMYALEGEANARLIAAAPELMEACQFAMDYFQDPQAEENNARKATGGNVTAIEAVLDNLKAAIAKAKGND